MKTKEKERKPPESASPASLCLLLLAAFFSALYFSQSVKNKIAAELVTILILATLITSFHIFQKATNYKNPILKEISSGDIQRSITKSIGIFSIYILISFLYKIIPEYKKDLYDSFFYALNLIKYPLIIIAPIYIYYTDARLRDPYDGLWHLGRLITFKNEGIDLSKIKQLALGWLVKAFFLPLMFSFSCKSIEKLLNTPFETISTYHLFETALFYIFLTDTIFACLGYLLTLKIYNTHIAKTENTMAGWVFAIICYPPFWIVFGQSYLPYNSDNYSWTNWLTGNISIVLWGGAIVALLAIYTASTVAFGVRFSNLTNRGIITIGPYRWTKHPAYITKNLSWWLISVPFLVTDNLQTTITHCIMLLGVNGIYYMRAKSEERMLMDDPVYRQYAEWIAEHGLFAKLNKLRVKLIGQFS